MVALHYNERPNYFFLIEKAGLNILKELSSLVSKTPWIIALILLLTLGLLYTLIAYLPLLISRRAIEQSMKKLSYNLDKIEEREMMEIHADLEAITQKFRSVTETSSSFFVFQPLNNEFKRILNCIKPIENQMFEKLYPDYNKELSAEENEELIEAFRPWKESA